jgi:hypothetical protein
MGYTHYWRRPVDNPGTAKMFYTLAMDAKRLIESAKDHGIVIRDWEGQGKPEFTESQFRFNGDATTGMDLGHETFGWYAFPEQPEWRAGEPDVFDFCKTAHKPYDAVVTAVLLRAKAVYGDLVSISSDGDWSEWGSGRALYLKTFGEVPADPFEYVLD